MDQGATFTKTLIITNNGSISSNLLSSTANGQIRKSYTSNTVVAQFTTIFDNANNILNISLPSNITANISYGRYVYDILLTDNNNIKSRLVQGVLEVSPSVTR